MCAECLNHTKILVSQMVETIMRKVQWNTVTLHNTMACRITCHSFCTVCVVKLSRLRQSLTNAVRRNSVKILMFLTVKLVSQYIFLVKITEQKIDQIICTVFCFCLLLSLLHTKHIVKCGQTHSSLRFNFSLISMNCFSGRNARDLWHNIQNTTFRTTFLNESD
jgi:hypothetical protein